MTLDIGTILQLGDPVEHRGVSVTPLFPRRSPVADYATLEDALQHGLRVTEVDASGSVPHLVARNPLDRAVLLYDGEELVGAKQNRILETTVLLPPASETVIPVACVEQGRWRRETEAFAAAPAAAHPELRRRKNAVRAAGAPVQAAVWDEVAGKAQRLGVHSPTGAHRDTYAARERDLAALRVAFPLQGGQSGALLALSDSLCLDYVSRPDAFARLYPKLLDGYLLDALERLDRAPAAAGALLERAARTAATRGPAAAGLGQGLALAGNGVVGSGLELDGELLQLSVLDGATPRGARIARPSRRR